MTEEQKKRYQELDKLVCDSIREMWSIMAPTEDEVNQVAEDTWTVGPSDTVETVTDPTSPIGMLFMLSDVEFLRECENEEDEEEEL